MPGRLPSLPFPDEHFDLTLVSYLLFVYEDQLDYDFHKQSLLEIMRVTRGEARLYPIVSFEAQRCRYIEQLQADADLSDLQTKSDFAAILDDLRNGDIVRPWQASPSKSATTANSQSTPERKAAAAG